MAATDVTIIDRPQVYTPVLNDIVVTLDSTIKTNCSYNYQLRLRTPVGTPVATLRLFPNETNGLATFKLDELLLDYLSDDVYAGLTGATTSPNSLIQWTFDRGDYTDGTTGCTGGTFSSSLAGITGGTATFYSWKGGLDWQTFHSYDWRDYVANSGMTANPIKFLTNAPDQVTTHLGADGYLSFLQSAASTGVINHLQILTTSLTGATAAFYLINPWTSLAQVAQRKITVGIGPENLNRTTLIDSTGATVAGPYITATTKSYTVTGGLLSGGTFTPYTETKGYLIDNSCFRFTPYRVLWVNTLGGIDAFTFRGNHFLEYTADRSGYTKRAAGLKPDNTWGYNLDSRGEVNYHNRVNQTVKTWTHWLRPEEFEWLSKELKVSAINAYISAVNENEDPLFQNFNLPIVITSTSATITKKGAGPKQTSLDLDFRFSFPEITQRG